MLRIRSLPLWILLLLATLSKADAETVPFLPFTAQYSGKAKGMSVEKLGSRKLIDLGDQQYRIEYRAEAMVYSLEETSQFQWQNGAPLPQRYRSSRGTFLKKRKSAMNFDWPNQRINFEHKGKKGTLPLSEGMQDPLTSTLYIAAQLQSDKSQIEFDEAVGHKWSHRKFVLKGKTDLETKMGTIPTFHLERLHDDKERETNIWLHADYPYIPVKVKQIDEGDLFLLQLTEFRIDQ